MIFIPPNETVKDVRRQNVKDVPALDTLAFGDRGGSPRRNLCCQHCMHFPTPNSHFGAQKRTGNTSITP